MNRIIITIILILSVSIIIFVTSMFISLPWWSFVIPCIIFGIVFPFKKYELSPFTIGFIAGFFVWSLTNLYYDMTLNSDLFDKIALAFDYSKTTILVFSGLIGGTLSGLALYAGKKMFINNPPVTLRQ